MKITRICWVAAAFMQIHVCFACFDHVNKNRDQRLQQHHHLKSALPPEGRATPCPKRRPPRPTVRSKAPANMKHESLLRGGPPTFYSESCLTAALLLCSRGFCIRHSYYPKNRGACRSGFVFPAMAKWRNERSTQTRQRARNDHPTRSTS